MSSLIKISAGVCASLAAVALGIVLVPQFQDAPTAGKLAVAKPVFVAKPALASSVTKSASTTASATATLSDPDKSAALVKLAEALRVTPAINTPGAQAPTRSLAFASADARAFADIAKPAVAPAPAPVSDKARQLCAQGLVALANGDIAGARAVLLRAADEGDARALMALGETYEPATLAGLGAIGVKGDPVRARDYYNKALAAGVGAARERLAALESN